MQTIDDILEEGVSCILDTGVRSQVGTGWYPRVYGAKTPFDLDLDSLNQVAESYVDQIVDFRRNNVFTVPGIAKELSFFRELVSDKVSYLSRKGESEALDTLCYIGLLLQQLSQKAKKKACVPKNPVFSDLLRRCMRIGAISGVKVNNSEFNSTQKVDYHTDEEIIATASYTALTSPIAVITTDYDLARITCCLAKDWPPIKKSLEENLSLYLVMEGMPEKIVL